MANAAEIHAEALMIDGHADTPQRFVDEGWEFTGALDGGMLSLDTARAGGLGAEFFAIWAEPVQWKGRFAHRTLALIDGVLEQVRKHPAELALCLSAEEIVAAHAAKKFAVLMGIEGGHSIENNLGLLRNYYRLGVRYMTLTWSNTNEWADSSGDLEDVTIAHHGGLSAFGRDVVREMNRLGMIVDVSHVSDACFWQVLETTRVPVIASHSSARALASAGRNMTDEMLRAVAANGGLVMVNFYPAFLDDAWRDAWLAMRSERGRARALVEEQYGKDVPYTVLNRVEKELAARLPRVPLAKLIDHIDYVARVAGIEHVGIGTDFDGIQALPEGIDSAADLWKVTEGLVERGYSAEEMRMLLGGNLLRVFGAVAAGAE